MSTSTESDLEREVTTLRRALESRTEIGIAIGMLAERYSCGTDRAWALLSRVSSHSNLKVREIARAVIARAGGTATAEDIAVLDELAAHLPGLSGPVRPDGDSREAVRSARDVVAG